MVAHDGLKWIISASGGLGLLEMVSESDTKWYAKEDAGLQGGGS